jgi:hypothetical protein
MAHFARVENGIVTNVVVVDNAHENNGQDYLNSIGLEGTWIQTSYHANFRKKFAGIGDEYLANKDAFRSAQPYPSWSFDFTSWTWNAPIPYPSDGLTYAWNEELGDWVLVEAEIVE